MHKNHVFGLIIIIITNVLRALVLAFASGSVLF